jgi:hypothetical protein
MVCHISKDKSMLQIRAGLVSKIMSVITLFDF